MRRWHALRAAGITNVEQWHQQCRAAVKAGLLRFYLRWVEQMVNGQVKLLPMLDCDYPGKNRLPTAATEVRVVRKAQVLPVTPKGRYIIE